MATPINPATVDDAAKNLAALMQGVLDSVISTYASYTMPLPGRRYWTLGTPSVDCEQVVVFNAANVYRISWR
jgi:hypothetical protein